jgi:hypothetical protein
MPARRCPWFLVGALVLAARGAHAGGEDPGPGPQFRLADRLQHVGRTASAWILFREAESTARELRQTARERMAHDRAAALEPFLPKLVIVPRDAAETPGLTVERDGVDVGRDRWGEPVPVDPGSHVVEAHAPGKVGWTARVDVTTDGKIVTLAVPPLADLPVGDDGMAAPLAPSATAPATSTVRPMTGVAARMPGEGPETTVVASRGATQRAAGWFFVGAGIVGLGAGAYFGSQWLDSHDGANAHCRGDECDAVGAELRRDATTHERGAIVAGGMGVAAMAFGAILAATAPSTRVASGPTGRLTFVPIVDAHRGGFGVSGIW